MWSRKKKVVLTASICQDIELLRLALEVLTGERVRLVDMDFNTGRCHVRIGDDTRPKKMLVTIDHGLDEDRIEFAFTDTNEHEWYVARCDRQGIMRVINKHKPFKLDGKATWIVGRSSTERWYEPLFGGER